ncbi:hypothetical protein SEA_BRUHMOMENT_104 [Arthrobacter phage BruhMoment]|nr:hypothetical protein SEA_BRUHMOMENT_104 [Arthrobacter phage BruhMoment]
MTQLGKYSSDRDNILHFMCNNGWANDTFGDVEAPTGFVYRITNNTADVQYINSEITSLIEDQLALYGIEDTPEFRATLEGHFLVTEDSSGFVTVTPFEAEADLKNMFTDLRDEYEAWAGEED